MATTMKSKQVKVEFSGISRMLTGQNEYQLQLAEDATIGDVIAAVAESYPALVGEVIDADRRHLIETNVFSINGQRIIQGNETEVSPQDDDTIILLSLLAGG